MGNVKLENLFLSKAELVSIGEIPADALGRRTDEMKKTRSLLSCQGDGVVDNFFESFLTAHTG